jgi:hypothetical protein
MEAAGLAGGRVRWRWEAVILSVAFDPGGVADNVHIQQESWSSKVELEALHFHCLLPLLLALPSSLDARRVVSSDPMQPQPSAS